MSARHRAMAQTRADIVEAAAALLRDEHPAAITVPAVADRAGVSVRTVYRHFPTKAALLDGTSRRFLERTGIASLPSSSAAVAAQLRALWPTFAEDIEAVRAEHNSPEGRELRSVRLAAARPTAQAAIDAEIPEIAAEDRDRLVDLSIALTSSAMFLELVDRLGRDPIDSADAVSWALRALLDTARAEGGIRP